MFQSRDWPVHCSGAGTALASIFRVDVSTNTCPSLNASVRSACARTMIGRNPSPTRPRMSAARPRTIAELRASGYQVATVKDEMRRNLIHMLREGKPLFDGIIGYEET